MNESFNIEQRRAEEESVRRLAQNWVGQTSSVDQVSAEKAVESSTVPSTRQTYIAGRRHVIYDLGSKEAPPDSMLDKRITGDNGNGQRKKMGDLTREDFKRRKPL